MLNQSQFNKSNLTIEIPPFLESQIKEGKVVLLLGSGASYEAKDKNGKHPPIGERYVSTKLSRFMMQSFDSIFL